MDLNPRPPIRANIRTGEVLIPTWMQLLVDAALDENNTSDRRLWAGIALAQALREVIDGKA